MRVLACVLALAAASCVESARSATVQPVTLKISGGPSHSLGTVLPYRDYLSWCNGAHHAAVAVLTQRSGNDGRFSATRWRVWLVGLHGGRRLVARPPGFADEQPVWSPDGGSLLFVRERNGYGRVMLRTHDRLVGPLRELGCQLGYHGHHDRGLRWRP